MLPIQRDVLTASVNKIHASAGCILVIADVLQGEGVLDAPGNVEVTITNTTEAFLDIKGITILENNGGVFFNGFQNEVSKAADPNAAIAAINQENIDAKNGEEDTAYDHTRGRPTAAAFTAHPDHRHCRRGLDHHREHLDA